MDINDSFWRGKRILITGHTGFKGSWLSLWLQRLGANLCGYALSPPTVPSLFNVARVGEEMLSISGDVRDLSHLHEVFENHHPEIVIHMAAQSLVGYSYSNPVETYTTNVTGTVNILESVRQSKDVRVVLIVTSDKCYENREAGKPFREDDPMGGFDPYSSSKGCAELITAAYRRSYFEARGIAVASGRAGNVIGGGDWAEGRLIPDILRCLVTQKAIKLRCPDAIRPWQHVMNPLAGYLRLVEQLWEEGTSFSEGWNFGPDQNDSKSVAWIVNFMMNYWGSKAGWKTDGTQHPHEAKVLRIDATKAKERLGWMPSVSLQDGLSSVVEWHKRHRAGDNMQQLTCEQIDRMRGRRGPVFR